MKRSILIVIIMSLVSSIVLGDIQDIRGDSGSFLLAKNYDGDVRNELANLLGFIPVYTFFVMDNDNIWREYKTHETEDNAHEKKNNTYENEEKTNSKFSGIYYTGEGHLYSENNLDAIEFFEMDMDSEIMIATNPEKIFFSEEKKPIKIKGLQDIGRPSISPDRKKIAVQANEGNFDDFNIYIIDLQTKKFEKISKLNYNEENPFWSNDNKIYYNSFSPIYGIKIHVYDASQGKEIKVHNQNSFHLSVSKDNKLISNSILGEIYDVKNFELVFKFSTQLNRFLLENDYRFDTRYPGQAELGSCPLSSDFSPDSSKIVFDCAVFKDGEYGAIIIKSNLDGTEMELYQDIIKYDPEFFNWNNFSPLSLKWV